MKLRMVPRKLNNVNYDISVPNYHNRKCMSISPGFRNMPECIDWLWLQMRCQD